ncbi:MAG TPA: Gfo/Idh/MocA family oxidoreductase [Candidatus Dormibacteraeota bacterium]|nr:Gfo/Idh/MocA family oxidoreductase [Candidatus Dormibacteraeota bacterium]
MTETQPEAASIEPPERLPASITVGFIGLGYAATALHLPGLRRMPGVRVIGGADTDARRRAEWIREDAGPAFTDLQQLLDRAPDVVVVCTPPHLHAEHCIRSFEAGAHVVCEKPFVENVAEADRVLAGAAGARRQVAVNHEFRYMPIFSELVPKLGEPEIGRPVFVSCVQFMDLVPWEEAVPWRASMANRSLFEGGVHLIDLIQSLVGRLPRTVTSHTSAGLDPTRTADAIHLVTLDYGGGLLAQVTIDRLCRAGTRYVDLRVDCERASLRSSFGGRAMLQVGVKRGERPGVRVDFGLEGLAWAERGLRRTFIARNPRHSAARATEALWAGVLEAWRRGEEPPTAAQNIRQTIRIVEAAYASAQSGSRVVLEAA